MKLPLSVLDLAPVGSGGSAAESVRRTVELAQLAERLGYTRHWFAEHHGMPSVASAAPEVLIAHVAAHTRTIRVGSGGVMLPNHAPLRVAEAFRTLAALHPGRIDLGLGRAPGSSDNASKAMRAFSGDNFPAMLGELLTWAGVRRLPDGHPMQSLHAMPDAADMRALEPPEPSTQIGGSGASSGIACNDCMGWPSGRRRTPAQVNNSPSMAGKFSPLKARMALLALSSEPGARPRPRSMRPGCSASSVRKASATRNGA
jgi:luciferase family oxidoreductase group 1